MNIATPDWLRKGTIYRTTEGMLTVDRPITAPFSVTCSARTDIHRNGLLGAPEFSPTSTHCL